MKQVLDLTKKLISIPSTSDNPKALKEVLEIAKKELDSFNFKEFEKNNNFSLLIYNTKELPKKFRLILNAHLDVVPAKDNQYQPKEKNGKLYGRGAYDMKTAAAAFILLFKEMAKKVNYPLGLQLVTDEEIGGFNGTKYQIEEGIKADFVIAGENTNLEINHQSKGIIWLKLTTKGVSSHGAHPWLGENAIWKMKKVLNNIEENFLIPSQPSWLTTVNLAKIETSNTALNKVPDECIAYLDIRYIPEEKETILNRLKKLLGQEGETEVLANEPAHLTNESNPYLKLLNDSIKKVLGKNGKLASHHGASDIRHYNKVGIEGVCFGPIGSGQHSDHEWVDMKSIEDYYKILQYFLKGIN